MRHRSGPTGYTLIEVLVVVVVIMIVATIAVPTLLNSIDRARQASTIADVLAISKAVESYSVDYGRTPVTTDMAALATILEDEEYFSGTPRNDGWNHELIYASAGTGYTIGSAGRDGGAALSLIGSGGPTHAFEDDIVYSNGSFVQWPEGVQQ